MSEKVTTKAGKPTVMSLEELQRIERDVALNGDRDPAGTKLPDGRTLADLRKEQTKQAVKDLAESKEFDRRSREANTQTLGEVSVTVTSSGVVGASPVTPEEKVDVIVTPSGVISASPVAPQAPETVPDEVEIAKRGEVVAAQAAEAVVANTAQVETPKKKSK